MPLPLPIALLCLIAFYGLSSIGCWLALRKKRRGAAMLVGSLALLVTGYAALVQLPRSVPDFVFWLLVAGIPLAYSVAVLVIGYRVRRIDAKHG